MVDDKELQDLALDGMGRSSRNETLTRGVELNSKVPDQAVASSSYTRSFGTTGSKSERWNNGKDASTDFEANDQVSELRRKAKGKGRMEGRAYDQLSDASSNSSRIEGGKGDEENDYPPELADEDEREEKRVKDNLARWSHAEKSRRASVRSSSVLSLPPSPVTAAGIVDLSRRGSKLFRRGSGKSSGSRMSVHTKSDGGRSFKGSLPHSDDENDVRSAEHEGTSSLLSRKASNRSTSPATSSRPQSVIDPSSPTFNEPTSDHMGDRRLVVDTSSAPRAPSRFIEDLPPQSPTNEKSDPGFLRPHSSLSLASTSSDLPSTHIQSRSGSSDHVTNPFLDSTSSSSSRLSHSPHRPARMSSDSYDSADSTSTIMLNDDKRMSRQDLFVGAEAEFQTEGEGEAIRMREQQLQRDDREASSTYERQTHRRSGSGDGSHRRMQREMEREEERVGWREWFLCGCFGREGDAEEQAGRTNPME